MADFKKGPYTPRPYVKNVLDDRKLRLTAPPTGGAIRPHELQVSLYNSNPGLTVFTNIDNDKNKGVIRAGMDAQAFYFFLERVIAVADHQGEVTEIIDNKEKIKDESTGKNVMQTASRTVIGKGKDGKVFISVLSPDNERPKIKFTFGQHYYHPVVRKEGTPLSDAEVSVAMARGWVRLMRNLVAPTMVHAYVAPTPQAQGGGGSGNSYQQKAAPAKDDSAFDFDDLPM